MPDERPKLPIGPPHGGDNEDGFCCGYQTIDTKFIAENQGRYRNATRWFVEGNWQCHIMDHHKGTLTPTPIKESDEQL